MSVKHPKAEVARRRWHFCFVPLTEVAMLVEEPSTASKVVIAHLTGDLLTEILQPLI